MAIFKYYKSWEEIHGDIKNQRKEEFPFTTLEDIKWDGKGWYLIDSREVRFHCGCCYVNYLVFIHIDRVISEQEEKIKRQEKDLRDSKLSLYELEKKKDEEPPC